MSRLSTDNGTPVVARVFDIANCGPRNRFVANGRLVHNSGGDKLNLQNFPSRGGNNTLRRALRAPNGQVLVACDSSQIEARLVAYVAGQEDLVQAFRNKRDVYCEFASEVYGRTITKADKIERFVGKTAVLSLGYGAGASKFREMLRIQNNIVIEQEEADRIVALYRQRNHKIVALWNRCNHALAALLTGTEFSIHETAQCRGGRVWLPNGMYLQYPMLRRTQHNGYEYIRNPRDHKKAQANDPAAAWTKIYGGKMVENVVQALAALVIREQMAAIGQKYPVSFQVHDEIIITASEDIAKEAEAKLVEVMSTPPKWAPELPVACESGFADNYGDT